jgi:apolipoprotein N-acyltransferase
MNSLAILFDVAPSGGVIGAVVGAVFLLVFLGVAFVAFKALKKTVKMAFRMAIVGVILLIAVVGSVSLWYFSSDASPKLKPPVERKRTP